jgi:hypothetical protein
MALSLFRVLLVLVPLPARRAAAFLRRFVASVG